MTTFTTEDREMAEKAFLNELNVKSSSLQSTEAHPIPDFVSTQKHAIPKAASKKLPHQD